ncbi:MFS general substrate transporter [Jaminaea rosea]|uniref:MFS general substrate transporter n=1 Tax=Jaminaea rosea TaxID=1569628 RepID=A0A316UWT9_9BASI|nr:MFS general substrate transporter [Jaminaea rosea]PWN29749.1 MFS general substrate transporter [Jaminaea rosea]
MTDVASKDQTKPVALDTLSQSAHEDPRLWPTTHKWLIVTIISLMGFISPLGSSIIIPGCHAIDYKFDLSSRPLSLLPVSLFVLGLGAGPFCLAPASELVGRRPVYVVTSLIFILFNVATGAVETFPGLCVLRFFAGVFGSTGPSLGAGSIGDLFSPQERGRAQSLYGLGPLLGPVVGNIIGGWIIQDNPRSWRWLLWTLTIMSGVIAVVVCVGLRETYAPVILEKKRKALANKLSGIGDGVDDNAVSSQRGRALAWFHATSSTLAHRSHSLLYPTPTAKAKYIQAFSRPFRLLFTNPICAIFSFYLGFCYGIIFLFLVEHPLVFQRREGADDPPPGPRLPTYGWGPGPAGLTYGGLGLGFLAAALVNAFLQDPIYRRLAASRGRLGWILFRSPQTIHDMLYGKDAPSGSNGCESDVEKSGGTSTTVTAVVSSSLPDATAAAAAATPSSQPATKGQPEYRLPLCLLGMLVLPVGLFIFGWAAQAQTHWTIPLIGSLLVGAGTILCFQSILVYLVDAFIPYSASATACAVLVRSVLAAVFPLFAQKLYRALGFGWGSSLLAFIALAGLPAPLVLFRYGEGLRERYRFSG